jgi:hypothetical protein
MFLYSHGNPSPAPADARQQLCIKTVQHATVEEVMFSVDPTDAPIHWLDSDHMIGVSCDACPFHGYVL